MASYLLIDKNNICVNFIEWDGVKPFDFGELTAVPYVGSWGKGWTWDGAKAVDPNPPPEPQGAPSIIEP